MGELMKIKEVAHQLNITARAIRFYEEKGLLSPVKQDNNQYRTFTENEVWRLQTIVSLREVGMGIADIKKALEEVEEGHMDELRHYLELQRSVMFSQWVELKQVIETTDQMIRFIEQEQTVQLEHIFRLAEGSKRLRESRKNWIDRWNYDQQAIHHDDIVRSNSRRFNVYANYEDALDMTLKLVSPKTGEMGLDIGSGTGNLAGKFLAQGIQMAAMDQSKQMLKQCRLKYPQMEAKLGNFLAIPHLDGQFDFIVTSFAFHHLTDEQKGIAMNEMRRVLKPHGRICITDVMFEDEQARRLYFDELKQKEQFDLIQAVKESHYAILSEVLTWFDQNGYVTKQHKVNHLLHVLLAVPI